MGDPNFAAICAFLAGVMDSDYATQFADAACRCGDRVFSVEVDEEVGEAWWFCRACNAAYQLRDPGTGGSPRGHIGFLEFIAHRAPTAAELSR